jgi:hypothetical protein
LATSIDILEEIVVKKDDVVIIYVKWITIKGKRVYASQFGKKAFRLEIPREKYRA